MISTIPIYYNLFLALFTTVAAVTTVVVTIVQADQLPYLCDQNVIRYVLGGVKIIEIRLSKISRVSQISLAFTKMEQSYNYLLLTRV